MSSYARTDSKIEISSYRHTWITDDGRTCTSVDLGNVDLVLDDADLARALAARFAEAASDLDRATAEKEEQVDPGRSAAEALEEAEQAAARLAATVAAIQDERSDSQPGSQVDPRIEQLRAGVPLAEPDDVKRVTVAEVLAMLNAANVDHSTLTITHDPEVWVNCETGERNDSVKIEGLDSERHAVWAALEDAGLSCAPYSAYDMWSKR